MWRQTVHHDFKRFYPILSKQGNSLTAWQWHDGVKNSYAITMGSQNVYDHKNGCFDKIIIDKVDAENTKSEYHGRKFKLRLPKEVRMIKEQDAYHKQQSIWRGSPIPSTFMTHVSKRLNLLLSRNLLARHYTVSKTLDKSVDDTRLHSLYVYNKSSVLTDKALLQTLRKETINTWPKANQLIDEMQGKFLSFLVQTTRAKHVLEIGCFTGYSALCLANGLEQDGSLVTCDIDAETMQFAQKFFEQSSHAAQITALNQDGLEYLSTLPRDFQCDFIFVDANKRKYREYYDFIMDHNVLHPYGLLVFDNTLFRGHVAAYDAGSLSSKEHIARSLAEFNTYVAQDSRTSQVIMPLWDGLTLVRLAR